MTEVRCPTCRRLFDPERTTAMPFCSPRCKQIDLGRWLKEEYGLPIEAEEGSAPLRQPAEPER